MSDNALKLKAQTPQDVKALSAFLQDSLVPITGMYYDPDTHLFSILANRFCWEQEPEEHAGEKLHKRTHAGVHISHVARVQQTGLNQKDLKKIHNLLALHADKKGEVHLIFSEGAHIRLHVDDLLVHLTDLYEAWWTPQKPNHPS
jgi:hypothetical protein